LNTFVFNCVSLFFAQQCFDALYVAEKTYYQKNKKLSNVELSKLFKSNPFSKEPYTKYTNTVIADLLLSAATGFASGYGLSSFLYLVITNVNQTRQLAIFGVALAGLVSSLSLNGKKESLLQLAINNYNKPSLEKCATLQF